ncbi:MAG: CvpA family protein [Pseudolabrys sp.]
MGSTNLFDDAVYICLFFAVVMGFHAGLLRSLATIFGYLVAAPLAVAVAPYITPGAMDQLHLQPAQNWMVYTGIFLVIGIVLSALMRHAIAEVVGPRIGILDRFAGALLGAVRIGLLAVLMVVIFDRIIPAGREPAFLAGSQLRPDFVAGGPGRLEIAAAGHRGLHRPAEEAARGLTLCPTPP